MRPSADQPPHDPARPDPHAPTVDGSVFGGLVERGNVALLLSSHTNRLASAHHHRPQDLPEFLRVRGEVADLPTADLHAITATGATLSRRRPQRVQPFDLWDHEQRRDSYQQETSAYGDKLSKVARELLSQPWWRLRRRRRLAGAFHRLEFLRTNAAQHAQALGRRVEHLRRQQTELHRFQTAHEAELLRAEACALELHDRQQRLLDRLEQHPPHYLLAALGQPPSGAPDPEGVARLAWRRGAAEIESYRAEAGITNPATPLGEPPANTYLRYRHRTTRVLLGQLQRRIAIDQDLPAPDPIGQELDILE